MEIAMERLPGPGDGTGERPDRGPGMRGGAPPEGWEQDLVRDMLAVVTSFAGRLYGQRSARAKRLRAAVAAETDGREDAA
jgi:hypothetical protein